MYLPRGYYSHKLLPRVVPRGITPHCPAPHKLCLLVSRTSSDRRHSCGCVLNQILFFQSLPPQSSIHDSIQLKQNFKKMKRTKSSGSSGSSSADEDKASRRALAMVRWSEILTDVSFPRSLSLLNYFTAPTFLSRARSNQRAQYYHPYIVSHCARTAVCIAVNTTKEHAFLLIYLYLDFQPLFALFFLLFIIFLFPCI